MYNGCGRLKFTFIIISLVFAFYLINLEIVNSFVHIFDAKRGLWLYLPPLIIEIVLCIPQFLFFDHCEKVLTIINFIFSYYFGVATHMFNCCLIYRVVAIWVHINIYVGLIFMTIVPVILSIIGVINFYRDPKIENIKLTFDKNDSEFHGSKKIMHISDLHLGTFLKRGICQYVVNVAKENNPDILVVTGDLLDGVILAKLEWLEPFKELKIPILFVGGNHEVMYGKEESIELATKSGFKYMNKDVQEFCGMNFIGLDFEIDYKEGLKELKNKYYDSNKPNIFLYHAATMKPKDLEKFNIFLCLSGHTHGGGMFPLSVVVYLSSKCFCGLYSYKNKNHIYVSSGLGGATLPFRIFSRRRITFITIEGNEKIKTKENNVDIV